MNRLKLIVVAGARPNFMKVGPFVKRIAAYNTSLGDGEPGHRRGAGAHRPAL